jgi:hypothetical protein
MRHDPVMRAAARAVYETVCPSEAWSPLGFEEAEGFGTVHYRQVVEAVLEVAVQLTSDQQRNGSAGR